MTLHKKKEFLLQKTRQRDGETFFSARDVMTMCGYDKWERFRGCVEKAMKIEKDEKRLSKEQIKRHFLFKTTNTGGRPREDILLSLWAMDRVLEQCDERKKEVADMKKIIWSISSWESEDIPQESVQQRNSIFIGVLTFVVIVIMGIYLLSFFRQTSEEDIHQEEIAAQQQKEMEDMQKYEIAQQFQKYSSELEDYIEQIPQNPSGEWEIVSREIEEYQQESPLFNYRTDFVNTLAGEKLIEAYFAFGNEKLYRDACGILTPNACNPLADDLTPFSRFWNRTVNGYENIAITHVQDNQQEQIYCVTYTYRLKDDLVDEDIKEVFHFNTFKDGDLEQITGRYCESVEKWGVKRSCPVPSASQYCQ